MTDDHVSHKSFAKNGQNLDVSDNGDNGDNVDNGDTGDNGENGDTGDNGGNGKNNDLVRMMTLNTRPLPKREMTTIKP